MRLFFDTSVLVQVLVDQLSGHEAALEVFLSGQKRGNESHISTHGLAECYATLTALPLKRRVTPDEALQLIEESILTRVQIVELGRKEYLKALARAQKTGLSSGAVYDALHVIAAEKIQADRIYTFNLKLFSSLALEPSKIRTP